MYDVSILGEWGRGSKYPYCHISCSHGVSALRARISKQFTFPTLEEVLNAEKAGRGEDSKIVHISSYNCVIHEWSPTLPALFKPSMSFSRP